MFSKGEDEETLRAEVGALQENGWTLNQEQAQLEKTYYFKTYTKVLVRRTQRTPNQIFTQTSDKTQ
jgi:pterin-4a-carbinolamine dehydratase